MDTGGTTASAAHSAPAAKPKKRAKSYWEKISGWKAAEIADSFLLGAEEGGFMGLEVLDDPNILQSLGVAQQAGQSTGEDASEKTSAKKSKKAKPTAQTEGTAADENGAKDPLDGKKKKKKKKQAKRKRDQDAGDDGEEQGDAVVGDEKKGKKARKKKKVQKDDGKGGMQALLERVQQLERENQALKAKQGLPVDTVPADGSNPSPASDPSPSQAYLADVSAWHPYMLHPTILNALGRLGFIDPTEIQQACLPAAIRDRRDIIGAAQTGSGKTLAFALPILHRLTSEREEMSSGVADGASTKQQGPLRALILAPTRELALQVCSHMQAVGRICRVRCEAIVGGLAAVKQERLLRACPPVIVGTPGRLWELISAGHAHLSDLKQLHFFVLDEADRMVQQGHFQELSHILDLLPKPGFGDALPEEEEDIDDKPTRSMKRVSMMLNRKNKHGKDKAGGETKIQAGEDGREAGQGKNNKRRKESSSKSQAGGEDERESEPDSADGGSGGDEQQPDENLSEREDSEDGMSDGQESDEGDEDDDAADTVNADEAEHVIHNGIITTTNNATVHQNENGAHGTEAGSSEVPPSMTQSLGAEHEKEAGKQGRHIMQTFVFSATLTLPSKLRKRMKKKLGGASGSASLESLMDRITFRGRPAVVDLTPTNKLADGVQEAQINCLEEEREHLLYYLLACHPGRTIVFANAVSAIRRLAALLKTLGLPASALHAQQQQRQRLKALDNFKKREDGILVATDVAARGLDVKDVSTVVHFHLPPSVDTYIHRCGRTGRMRTDGVSIAIVTPKESPRFALLCQSLGRPPPPVFPVDPPVLAQAQKRWKLAIKIDGVEHQLKKWNADKSWVQRTAAMVGLDVSDDALGSDSQVDDDKIKGLERRETALRTGQLSPAAAKQLRIELAQLLARPLQPHISRSFFTGGASMLKLLDAKGPKPTATTTPDSDTEDEAAQKSALTEAAPSEVMSSTMAKTLSLAKHLVSTAQASDKTKAGAARVNGPSKLSKKQAKLARQDPQAARLALARSMLKRRQEKKQQQVKTSKRGMVVIAENVARNLHGPNAVQVMKQQLRK